MNKVFFLKNTESFYLEQKTSGAILVFHAMYKAPTIEGIEVVEWDKFRVTYSNYEPSLIILVGLNRMITPSNRCDYVHEYLTTMTPNIPKISIDNSPFIGEPWRLFFHYLYAQANNFGVNYSYPVEREWQSWFYREVNDCRLSADNLKLFIRDTYSELERINTSFFFTDVNSHDLEWYQEAKAFIFEKFDTPKLLIQNLLKMSNSHFQTNIDFNSYLSGSKFQLPDLPVYRFIAEENTRRLNIYNKFTHEEIHR